MRSLLPVMLIVSCGLLTTDASRASEGPADESGFLPLFDGTSLAGWHGATESYVVEEGVIWSLPDKAGNLYTDATWDDFILRFEFRLTEGANNGIGLRVSKGGRASRDGMEIQVLDNTAKRYEKLKPYQSHGSVYGIAAAEKGHLRPVGEWNEQEIRCIGRQVTVVLNGKTILDVDLDEAVAEGTADGREHPGLANQSGHICLCGHKSRVDFRNLRIKPVAAQPE